MSLKMPFILSIGGDTLCNPESWEFKMNMKRNESFLTITYLLMILMPLYDCIMYALSILHFNLPLRMFHLYLLIMIYMVILLVKFRLPLKNLLVTLGIISFYGINYLWTTEQARVYFNNTDVSALLLVFIPVSCICTARITDWDNLFNKKIYLIITDVIIVVSLLSKINFFSTSDYMSFSFRLLPLWGLCLISAYCFRHKIQWLFLGIGIFEGLVYGARAPLLYLIIMSFIIWLLLSGDDLKRHKFTHLVPAVLAFIASIVFIEFILPTMVSSFTDVSYVLRRLQGSSLFESTGREQLFAACRKEISNMGFAIHGLFYDRTVLPNGWYAHNFVYEILLSFGWFLGVSLIVFILYFIIKTFVKQNIAGKILVVYAICAFFLRYIVSGSIFDETEFMLFMSILYSLQARYSSTLNSTAISVDAGRDSKLENWV